MPYIQSKAESLWTVGPVLGPDGGQFPQLRQHAPTWGRDPKVEKPFSTPCTLSQLNMSSMFN